MNSDFPLPLVPDGCDLRGMPFMPLDVIRLLDSDLFALSTGDEFKAAVALWCKSWNQVPAASLPNDERVLAHLSGAKNWKKVRAGAMRGWILCADGRWYHPVVAEKAKEALPMRQHYEDKKAADAARKAREREERKAMFDALRQHGMVPEWNTPTKQLRELVRQHLSQPDRTDETPPVTEPVTPVTRDQSQPVTAKTETVKGTVKGINLKEEKPLSGKPDDIPPGFAEFWKIWPKSQRKDKKAECVKRWKQRGLETDSAAIIAGVVAKARTKKWMDGFEPEPLTFLNQRQWLDDIDDLMAVGGEPSTPVVDSRFKGAK